MSWFGCVGVCRLWDIFVISFLFVKGVVDWLVICEELFLLVGLIVVLGVLVMLLFYCLIYYMLVIYI